MLLQNNRLHRSTSPACRGHVPCRVGTSSSGARRCVSVQQQRRRPTVLASAKQDDTTYAITKSSTSSTFLQTLSHEQLQAAATFEQHARVIAGPGSGKTRTIIARITWLLKQNVPPWSILAITFTRKAADELKQRLEDELGQVPTGLKASTFHSLCIPLLRRRMGKTWSIAEEEDNKNVVGDILPGPPEWQRKDNRFYPVGGTSASLSATRAEAATFYREMIGRMKNFVESTYSAGKPRSGADILQQLVDEGAPSFVDISAADKQYLPTVYDKYNRRVRAQGLLDFDDLLHEYLAILHSEPDVKSQLHRLWRHILVDEGQDTNLCQFELISQITGPDASLFMVGDPDQAIYGFRGARSDLMQRRFDQLYGPSAVTYYLSDNYRSKPTIIKVADSIRGQLRPKGHTLVPGRSMRGADSAACVELVEAYDRQEEVDTIVQQLQEWHKQGRPWNEMAVLCRVRRPLRNFYRAAIAQGIPSYIQTGDMWDSPEVKAALALLRAVVYPTAAGEGLKRRIIQASTEVKVPLTKGLGGKPIEAMEAAIDSQPMSPDNSSSSTSSTTLGSCLLSGCGMDSLSPQQAADIWQQWQAAAAGGQQDAMQLLQGLAPPWQQLPGLKALTKKQRAALERLRGLVRLAAAAAVVGQPPKDVLQLLLTHSGIQDALHQAAAAAGAKITEQERKQERLENLQFLLELAGNTAQLQGDVDLVALLDIADASSGLSTSSTATHLHKGTGSTDSTGSGDSVGSGSDSVSSSSGSGNNGSVSEPQQLDGPALLRQFMDLCSLQGDGSGVTQAKPRVQFLTVHGAKGREYECVIVSSFHQGALPLARAVTPVELEEERNVGYVAVTRPKDELLITWPGRVVSTPKNGLSSKVWIPEVSSLLSDVLHDAATGTLPWVSLNAEAMFRVFRSWP